MERPQLVEYVKGQLAKGATRAEIENHLRSQQWDESVIAEVLGAAVPYADPAAPPPVALSSPPGRRPNRILTVLLALAIAVAAWSAWQLYRSYAVAKMVREKTKFVEFSGKIAARVGADGGREFGLLSFRGQLDSSRIDTPKAAMQVAFDGGATLSDLPPETDGHLLALTLLSVATGAQTIGGAEVRFADWNTYLRPARTPFAEDRNAAAVAGLINSLIGPNILTGFWVKIPAPAGDVAAAPGVLTTEHKATWALLFRPTEKIFGESKELRFTGRQPGGEINGVATEIHRYAVDGPWLTKQLVKTLRAARVDDKLDVLAMLQNLVLGGDANRAAESLDSLAISDGELSVWVGRKDTLPYRMALRIEAQEGTRAPLSLGLSGEMDIDYVPSATIQIPAQSLDLKQLQEQLGLLQSLGNLFR